MKSLALPLTIEELRQNPDLIRQFRLDYYFHQGELALALGLTRQTLSKYQRRLRPLPADIAAKILKIWRDKAL